ncbi:hypothetical protein C0J26_20385 [Pseudomonas baetica]|nr:hypothetical protein C0J26_20385 [Pseudomonas baetica]
MWERGCSRKRCIRQLDCRLTLRLREQDRSHRVVCCSNYLQTLAMASASSARRVASMPATFARPELTMYML